jgi:D-alanyl-D-alanine-carboxypeptidase/D-alanyl-D-alanine-endopeptidase
MGLWFAATLFAWAEAQPRTIESGGWKLPSDKEVRKLVEQQIRGNGVGMVVGIVEPSGARRIVAFGQVATGGERPVDARTVFLIGSVTKTFTTLLLADMVTRGEVKLTDEATKYLPAGVSLPEQGRAITMRDLATHRSGLPSMPNNIGLAGLPNPVEAYTSDQLYEYLAECKLETAPGERWRYSNLGVALLGRLLANRAGLDYDDLLAVRVLQPLGMTDSAVRPAGDLARRVAPGHDKYLRPVETWEMRTMPGSGSLRSTADDMLKFIAAYLGLVDTPLKAAMAFQLKTRYPEGGDQALGWPITKVGEEEVFIHEGGKAGYRSVTAFNLRTRTGVVILANTRTNYRLSPIALHLLAGKEMPPATVAPRAPVLVSLTARDLEKYVGRYRAEDGRDFQIARRGDHLLTDFYNDGGAEFYPISATDFVHNDYNDEVSFESSVSGQATVVRIYGNGRADGSFLRALRTDAVR